MGLIGTIGKSIMAIRTIILLAVLLASIFLTLLNLLEVLFLQHWR